jgi:hypothetical protein
MEGELKVGGRPADVACLQPIKADLPSVTHSWRRFGAASALPPPPFTTAQHMACDAICLSVVDPRPFFGLTSQRPRPRGPKGAHLKEETKNEPLSPSQLCDWSSGS